MEPNSLETVGESSQIEYTAKHFKHKTELEKQKMIFLYLIKDDKLIALQFKNEPSKAFFTSDNTIESNFRKIRLGNEYVKQMLTDLDKYKKSSKNLDSYVVNETLESNFWNEICQADCSSEEPYTDVYCYTPSADTYEDGGPALDLESSLFSGDPKKSPELRHLFNKIRRAHNCPELFPPGLSQLADSQSEEGSDLEVDVGVSQSPNEDSSGTHKSLSLEPGKTDTNLENERCLLIAPAAEKVAEMGFDSDAIVQAISSYINAKGNVKFAVSDLLDILTGKGVGKRAEVALSN